MREYTIMKVAGQPDWCSVPALDIDCLLWTEAVPVTAAARICYDDQALHVQLSAKEPNIRAENTQPLQQPCEDSCLEFFFCPDPGDSRYFNIELNPNGLIYLGFGSGMHDLVRMYPEDQPIVPHAQRTQDGWQITYAVPFAFIRRFFPDFQPVSGGTIRANCFKCGDLTVQPHYLSWNPVASETPQFHRPQDFGLMRFA